MTSEQEAVLRKAHEHNLPIITFKATSNDERMHIGPLFIRLDLSRVPPGEMRELCRRGWRDLVLHRTARCNATRDYRAAHNIVVGLLQRIERPTTSEED